jgi:arginine exporter protein ArgO
VKLLRDGLVAVRAHAADPTGVAVMSGEDAPRSEWRTYLTFVGLTAVNPVTVIYFAALVIGLPDRPSTLGEQLAFAFGAFAASFAWQLTIAGASAVAHRRLPPSFRAWTTVLGAVVVLVFAGIVTVDVMGSVAGSS